MTDTSHRREQTSLHKLVAVSQARQIRLRSERDALAQREQALERASDRQALDEALVARQRAEGSNRWRSWARTGGTVRDAVSWRRDCDLLADMSALLAHQRAPLEAEAHRLSHELEAWARRWRARQAFDDSLATRTRALHAEAERATERQPDEETSATRASAHDRGAAQAAHR